MFKAYGKSYKAGTENDVVESSSDLTKIFPNKFERLPATEPSQDSPPVGAVNTITKEKVTAPTLEVIQPPKNVYGEDVSMYYAIAEKRGVKVYRNGETFVVVNDKDVVVNSSPLRLNEIKPFLKALKKG